MYLCVYFELKVSNLLQHINTSTLQHNVLLSIVPTHHHAPIAFVPALSYFTLLDSLEDGTLWFLKVQAARAEFAVEPELAHLRKIIRDLLLVHVHQPPFFYAGSIDDIRIFRETKHFGKRGGMDALIGKI